MCIAQTPCDASLPVCIFVYTYSDEKESERERKRKKETRDRCLLMPLSRLVCVYVHI